MNSEDIYNYCEKLIKKENVEFIYNSVYLQKGNINKFSIGNLNIKENDVLNIRVIENKQIGNYKVTNITKRNILSGITKAKKIAKLKNKLPVEQFGSGRSSKKIKQDKEIKHVDFDKILEETSKEITKEKYFKSYEGSVSKTNYSGFYLNPFTKKNIDLTTLYLEILINAKFKKNSTAFYTDIFTRKDDINIKQTFDQAKINTNNLLNPTKGEKGTYTIILTPEVTKEFLEKFVVDAAKGDVIEEKNSYLHAYKNKQLFSKRLNIIEDPFIDYFTGSQVIDNQGFKTSKKNIIVDGVFKKAVYDQYTAIKYNKKPTGNGVANDGIDFTNILQKPGSKKIDNIIGNIKHGVIIYSIMGMHTNKITNGEFSLVISSGKIIENGKLGKSITNLNFTGNVKDILKNISFSKEQKFFGDSLYSFMIIPNIKLV